jgi:hypothetical protein
MNLLECQLFSIQYWSDLSNFHNFWIYEYLARGLIFYSYNPLQLGETTFTKG